MSAILWSCKNSGLIDQIEKQYKESIDSELSEIKIQDIEVLEIEKKPFKDLSRLEIQLIDKENLLIGNQIKSIDSIEFMLNKAFDKIRDDGSSSYSFSNSNAYHHLELDTIKSLLNYYEQQNVKLQIEKLENDIKIKRLIELSETSSNVNMESLRVKHKVLYYNNNSSFTDTLYFLSFQGGVYKYLNRNLTYI